MANRPSLLNLPFDLDLSQELLTLETDQRLTLVNVGNVAAKAFLMKQVAGKTKFCNFFWASGDEQADTLKPAVDLLLGDSRFIKSDPSLHDFYGILSDLEDPSLKVFLFEDFSAFSEKLWPAPEQVKEQSLTLKVNEKVAVYALFEQLETRGYQSAPDLELEPGTFIRRGEVLYLFPFNADTPYQIVIDDDQIESIKRCKHDEKNQLLGVENQTELLVSPGKFNEQATSFFAWLKPDSQTLFVADDLDREVAPGYDFFRLNFTAFPDNDTKFFHLNFFSVLPFYTIPDFVVEVKERLRREFRVVIATKKLEEIKNICKEYELMWTDDLSENSPSTINIYELDKHQFLPHSFQNNDQNLLFLTDREIFQFRRNQRTKKAIAGMNTDLINSLKTGDFVVHLDHGVARFDGIIHRTLPSGEREYLKLQYSGSDRLFVPVESAEKVSKYVGDDDPKLTKLGGAEWQKVQKKIKAETAKIAKELIKLYAQRELAKGFRFTGDDPMMDDFCDAFPYELTPGQKSSWESVRIDMEKPRPTDRLVCGDVGFGKTEIAMRAAFKAFRSGKQCAILAPITILAEQHYQGLLKRVAGKNYGVRIELMSRFQSSAEQNKILKDLEHGLVDIVIGTHRLLSGDVKFKNLGLLVIDEEQRFGVKQKERLKSLRSNVDLLTLTATPIPRTLHMGLNKLKDVSTITTPPPGRLPVVTEVRRFNLNLIRERILAEIKRGGQVYFLHNQVKTIESQKAQLQTLIPEARFITAHGQLPPLELEDRIHQFKEGKFDVLIASTIIENGIDLANANTLFVNQAERFGLSQLYQLRGRVGRSRTQAYAYFLYKGQKLDIDARKRLRAIVEASELGSGFQIAMKDLEIRGAGEILGASQSGAMKDTGVAHFVRMLNKTVEELKSGEISQDQEEAENIAVEIPLSAYIPPSFIPNADEKIQTYQSLASAENLKELNQLRQELQEDFGDLPPEVENLIKVLTLKQKLKKANLSGVRVSQSSHKNYEIVLRMSAKFTPDQIFPLLQNAPEPWTITASAIKQTVSNLGVNWYQDLCRAVEWLEVGEKK